MAERKIERAAPKRRLVGGLVHDHEQEGDEIALHDISGNAQAMP